LGANPPLPSPLLPSLSFSPFPSPFSFPCLPLEVGLLNTARIWGAVSSPSGVWGRAPAEIEFGGI